MHLRPWNPLRQSGNEYVRRKGEVPRLPGRALLPSEVLKPATGVVLLLFIGLFILTIIYFEYKAITGQ